MRWEASGYKERLRHRLKQLKAVKTWQLLVLLLLSTLVSATLLRLNNLTMIDLRRDVVNADEKGDEAQLEQSVNNLARYVRSHMNTGLGDAFYLTAAYERARQVAVQAAGDTSNPDSALYQQASVQCQNSSERARAGGYVPCVLNKVRELGNNEALVSELRLPNAELYSINFVSPLWSPDAAGWSVLLTGVIIVLIVARITGAIVLRLLLKRRFSAIS